MFNDVRLAERMLADRREEAERIRLGRSVRKARRRRH